MKYVNPRPGRASPGISHRYTTSCRYSTRVRLILLVSVLCVPACDSGKSTFSVGPENSDSASDGPAVPAIDERESDIGGNEETPEGSIPPEGDDPALEPPADVDTPQPGEDQDPPAAEPEPVEDYGTVFIPSPTDITDLYSIYEQDGYAQTDVVRIDLKTSTTAGTCTEADLSGCTLLDVINDTDSRDEFKVDIPVHFSSTDFADDGTVNNAELRQRGGGARFAPQKSFRIKLDDKNQLWRGERHLQLNKHPYENSRFRNKLSFDLMSNIAHLPSFRTQFVNLWIDDGAGPVDYGFYTHVERGDERYLKRRNLGDDDNLYKAEFFRFRQSDLNTLQLDENGKPINKDLFESVLEIENGKVHHTLVEMLSAMLDPEQTFESVFDRHFNDNNVLTWIAVNLLLGQQDITRHNYFLYNPQDSDTFYFLPWDYDFTFQRHDPPANEFTPEALRDRLGFGYANGSKNEFLDSYYRSPGAHGRIIAAVAELREDYLSDTRIAESAATLKEVSYPFVSALPDVANNPHYSVRSGTDFAEKVAFNHDAILNHFSIPLPPTLLDPELKEDGNWHLSWKPALELTGHTLTYELQVATSLAFLPDEIELQVTDIEDSDGLVQYHVDSTLLSPNTPHFVRLVARSVNEPERFWQIADNYVDLDGVRYYGVVELAQKL